MSDFFISYTKADRSWAEWIGHALEEEGYSVILQAWDFAAGSNFVVDMHRAIVEATRTIALLSPDYLKSAFAAPEWAAAFADDPEGVKRKLLPICVRDCQPAGLLTAINYIDLVDLEEAGALQELMAKVSGKRGKPTKRPEFPGSSASKLPPFPGRSENATTGRSATPYMPRLRRAHSDLDKRKFLRSAFSVVARHFETGLETLAQAHQSVQYDFNPEGSSKFTAEIFVDGKSKARCTIWLSNQLGDGIAYYEEADIGSGTAMNEVLGITDHEGVLVLSAHMGAAAFGRAREGLDLNHLTPDTAAEYLWRRFVQRLE